MVAVNEPASGSTERVRRSALCVPAGDARRVRKALASGADEVVIDLEDAVAVGDKSAARAQLTGFDRSAADAGIHVTVRVNAPRSPWCHRDLEAVASLPWVSSVVVPKVESRADVGYVERLLDGLEAEAEAEAPRSGRITVQALVETAAGIVRLADITSGVDRLAAVVVGYADLAASLGLPKGADPAGWLAVQSDVVAHARAAGIDAVDGPFLGVGDDPDFRAAVSGARQRGFDAKWVIHPRQVGEVNRAFAPSEAEVDHARRVLQALDSAALRGRGAGVVDGALVDEAMALSARKVLRKAPA
jgi:citrate lyase subunit beta/citryl-CoA lyase